MKPREDSSFGPLSIITTINIRKKTVNNPFVSVSTQMNFLEVSFKLI